MVQQCIYKRAVIVAGSRMHHHALRLVDNEQLAVLINYIERYILRYRLGRLQVRHCDL